MIYIYHAHLLLNRLREQALSPEYHARLIKIYPNNVKDLYGDIGMRI
jgi:hypothetical protein